jgi:hypothetical protein
MANALAKRDCIELFFIVNTCKNTTKHHWSFFSGVVTIEHKILSLLYPRIKEDTQKFNLKKVIPHRIENLKDVKDLALDLLVVENIKETPNKDVINSIKDGVLAIAYEKVEGFWSVYKQKPSTKFALQRITQEGDCMAVLSAKIPTRRSYTENSVDLHNESYAYLIKVLLEYSITGTFIKQESITTALENGATVVSFKEAIIYLSHTIALFFSLVVNRIILRRYKNWGIAFIKSSWHDAKLSDGIAVVNRPNHFFADPFVVKQGGRTICFTEEHSYNKGRAHIAAIELFEDGTYRYLGCVIEELFHLSFPYIFHYEDELYMMPESSEADAIRLYRCSQFPLQWEYVKEVKSAVSAVDSMLFAYQNRWWLFSNMSTSKENEHASTLMAFYAKSPLDDIWHEHKLNPIVFNSEIARNGGILEMGTNTPIRVRQKQSFNQYGSSFSLAKITDLTPSSFCEEKISEVLPTFFKDIKGCHHLHSNGEFTVYDYLKFQRVT